MRSFPRKTRRLYFSSGYAEGAISRQLLPTAALTLCSVRTPRKSTHVRPKRAPRFMAHLETLNLTEAGLWRKGRPSRQSQARARALDAHQTQRGLCNRWKAPADFVRGEPTPHVVLLLPSSPTLPVVGKTRFAAQNGCL